LSGAGGRIPDSGGGLQRGDRRFYARPDWRRWRLDSHRAVAAVWCGHAGLDQAIGTSAVAVNAFANLVPHARERHIRWRPKLIFAAAGLAGAFAGSSIGKAVDGHRLLILFALLMLFVTAMMLRASKADSGAAGAERPVNLWWLGEIGLGAGALSGFYGIGGGFLVVPGLILGTGMPTIAAIGSSLAAVGIFGMTTAVNYAVSGLVD
jgi:uncharacterized protein